MKDKLGQRLEFTGTARNAKGGAVLVMGDEVVYLEHVDAWPAALLGTETTVEGTLAYKKIIPDPGPGPEYTAGAYGKQYVLEQPRWK
jgi:hypothetical protein